MDPVTDRVQDVKGRIGLFIAEHCLPFSLSGPLLNLVKCLCKDIPAVNATKMERTTCTYTINHGIAQSIKDELRVKLKGCFISLNIDEVTNHAKDKVLNVLCQYFDKERDMFVTELLGSRVVNLATSVNIFRALESLLAEYEIQWEQVVSVLMDNCNVMRGCKSGVEARVLEKNPNMLDISGDTVHMVNNACQAFFDEVEKFYSVQPVLSQMYYDIQDSLKQKELFGRVQAIVGSKPLSVLRPLPTRFLQMHEVAEQVLCLLDPLWLFFYGLLGAEEKKNFQPELTRLFDTYNISKEQQLELLDIWKQSRKNRSSSGQGRFDSIALFLFHNQAKSMFFLKLYTGITGQFKTFVKKFQTDKPMAHHLHVEIFTVLKEYYAAFISPEKIPLLSATVLSNLDIENVDNHLPLKRLSVGADAHQALSILKKDRLKHSWVSGFLTTLKSAYIAGGKKLKSLPLLNRTLIRLSAFSPDLQRNADTASSLLSLAESMPNVIRPSELGALDQELRLYNTDDKMSILEFDTECPATRIDQQWYSILFSMKDAAGHAKYPLLATLTKAALSAFSGPIVEGSFNLMDDILEKDRSNMTPQNFEALLKIKIHLKASNKNALTYPISLQMRRSIYGASAQSKSQAATNPTAISFLSSTISSRSTFSSSSSVSSALTSISSASTSIVSSDSTSVSSDSASVSSTSTVTISSDLSSSTPYSVSIVPSTSSSSTPSACTATSYTNPSCSSSTVSKKRKSTAAQQSIMKFFKC